MLTLAAIPELTAAKRVLVAYSGGLDSTVLLHLCNNDPLLKDKKILAIHVHHGLSPNADSWQQHCEQQCQQWQVRLTSRKVSIDQQSGESLEKLARDARYQVFASLVQAGDVLLTAHHQDDQAETVLLQLIRGTGIKGLAAMPAVNRFHAGYLVRPLLQASKAQLEAYAKQQQLTWIHDESNDNTRFERNFIRHEVLPSLQQKWPSAAATIARTATHHAEAQELLDLLAAQDLVQAQRGLNELDIPTLQRLSYARQKNCIRYLLHRLDYPTPSEAVLDQILTQILQAEADAEPVVQWQSVDARRYQDKLYLLPSLPEFNSTQVIAWQQQYQIPELDFTKLKGKLTLRFRQGGERFHPANRDKSQTLKKLMQEWQVVPWLRDRTPLLFCDDELVAVIGYAVAKAYAK